MDGGTAFARLVTGALGASHPIRLLTGVSVSFILKTVVIVLLQYNPDSILCVTLNSFNVLWYIVIITPLLFTPLIWRRRGALEGAIMQASTLRMLLEEAGIKGAQRQIFWHAFIDKYVQSLKPDLSKTPSLREVFDDTLTEVRERNVKDGLEG